MNRIKINKHLPLTEATYYILLALVTPQHGYAVMQEAEETSASTVKLAPGTLYGALTTLEESKLIHKVGEEGRRKIYRISDAGREVLLRQVERLKIMLQGAAEKLERPQDELIVEDKK